MFRLKEFVCRMMVQRKRKTTLYYSRQMWFILIEIVWKIWFIYHMLANHNHVVMMLNWNWEPKTWHSDFNLYVILYYVLCKQYSTGMLFCLSILASVAAIYFILQKTEIDKRREVCSHHLLLPNWWLLSTTMERINHKKGSETKVKGADVKTH